MIQVWGVCHEPGFSKSAADGLEGVVQPPPCMQDQHPGSVAGGRHGKKSLRLKMRQLDSLLHMRRTAARSNSLELSRTGYEERVRFLARGFGRTSLAPDLTRAIRVERSRGRETAAFSRRLKAARRRSFGEWIRA